MEISHFAVFVNDLEKIKNFYEKYFEVKCGPMYHNPKTGLKTYFLTFNNGSRLEIMTRPDIIQVEKNVKSAGYIHIAISVKSKDKVDQLTKLLENDGYHIISKPRLTGDGYYESCILDPENNLIEIVE